MFDKDDNGNQGDYIINIPDGSLYINGTEINPSDYEYTVNPLSSGDGTNDKARWYALHDIAPTSPKTKDLSSLQVWLDYSSAPPIYKVTSGLSASASDLSSMYSKVQLTKVDGYRSIPVVKSALHLNSVMIPFRLTLKDKTPATPAEEPTYTWEMDQIVFSLNGKVQYLANCEIPPS